MQQKQQKHLISFAGTITLIGEVQTSQKGTKYMPIIVDIEGMDKQEFCLFNDRATAFKENYSVGDFIQGTFTMASRQFTDRNNNDRYATSLNLSLYLFFAYRD